MRLLTRPTTRRLIALAAASGLAGGLYLARTPVAEACGCFTPPDPTVPIVQSGERITFAREGKNIISHIQIQYSGDAEEFGWLLPLPAVPEFTLGTDELFTQLVNTTQPKYVLDREYLGNCPFDPSRFGGPPSAGASEDSDGNQAPGDDGGGDVLVIQDSVGPFDYAVLRADSKQPMFDWLDNNGYFVPAGTDDAVAPYIRPGGYFLALKLRKGNDVGDLQPVVVKYESDLPMIPIVLTSVAADPDMGIMVWMLGDSRAIPRNYFHTKINDAKIDWINFGQNYVDVITDAVDEAEEGRSFVTEYAGPSNIMVDRLDPEWRFGNLNELETLSNPVEYVNYLNYNGYAAQVNAPPFFGAPVYSSQMLGLLQRHLAVPSALEAEGITPNDYYTNFQWYVTSYAEQRPDLFEDLDLVFDAVELTAEIEERVVTPTLEAGQMFRDNSYLTRLFTTLSPHEMVRDPVFSFNPELADVASEHRGRLLYFCDSTGTNEQGSTPARLITEDGFVLRMPHGTDNNPWLDLPMPSSRYTEVLREEGQPDVVGDNTDIITQTIEAQRSGGCSVAALGDAERGQLAGLVLIGAFAVLVVRRRRRS